MSGTLSSITHRLGSNVVYEKIKDDANICFLNRLLSNGEWGHVQEQVI